MWKNVIIYTDMNRGFIMRKNICLSVARCASHYICFHLFTFMFIAVCHSAFLSVSICDCQCLSPSVCQGWCLSVSVCLSVSICLSAHLSHCLSAYCVYLLIFCLSRLTAIL